MRESIIYQINTYGDGIAELMQFIIEEENKATDKESGERSEE